jgi:hypothetical protein
MGFGHRDVIDPQLWLWFVRMHVMDGRNEANDRAVVDRDDDMVAIVGEEARRGIRIDGIVEHRRRDSIQKVLVARSEDSDFHVM